MGDAENLPNQRQAGGRPPRPVKTSKTVVFVLNVPADATEDTVRQVFSQKGAIKSIVDRTREGKDTKAFSIQYEEADAAAAALALDNTQLHGSALSVRPKSLRPNTKRQRRKGPRSEGNGDAAAAPMATIQVAEANPKRIFVGNLRGNVSADQLKTAFADSGKVAKVELSNNQNFAFVQFEHAEDADAAVNDWNGQELAGQTLRVTKEEVRAGRRQARPPRRNNNNQEAAPASATNGTGAQGERPRRPRKPRRANPTRVFMAGVPSDCELSVLQSQFPAITKGSVRKQVAFVFFDSVESADAAVSRNGEDIFGTGPVRIEKSIS